MRERFLPEFSRRGRDRRKLQYAVLAAAALHGGAEPDLPDEAAWRQADDFWQHAILAAIPYIRAAAGRAAYPCRRPARNRPKCPPAARLTTGSPHQSRPRLPPDAACCK